MGQDGNIAAHLSLLCAADIWGGVLHIYTIIQNIFLLIADRYLIIMLRGVRVVEGADLERLCGVTHREFESLPVSHITLQITHKRYSLKYNLL